MLKNQEADTLKSQNSNNKIKNDVSLDAFFFALEDHINIFSSSKKRKNSSKKHNFHINKKSLNILKKTLEGEKEKNKNQKSGPNSGNIFDSIFLKD